MQHENSTPARDAEQRRAQADAEVSGQRGTALLSNAWEKEGFDVARPDAVVEPGKGMAFFYAVADAAVHEKRQIPAAIRCACMVGPLFAAIAFFLALILTAATTNAPNPTYILYAAILGIIIGIISSYAVRLGYRSFGRFLCAPGYIDDSMKSAIAGNDQAAHYADAILAPENKAGVLRGDIIHIAHLL